ncbi:MAG: hypothetical protein ABI047_11510 [Jatrophihabitantaceae bacterium]
MGAQAMTSVVSTGGAGLRAGRRTARVALTAAVAVLALGMLAGCASAPGRDGGTDGRGGQPEKALAGWQPFPVSASPRPVVLTRGMVLDPSTGFATSEDKLAYINGNYDLGTALPTAPATFGGYAVVTAKAALDRLGMTASGQQSSARLRIVKVRLTRANFGTDRGLQLLPAWQFTLAGVTDSVRVFAVAQSPLWPAKPSEVTAAQEQASIAADDQSVTYSFVGGPTGPSPCGVEYKAKVTESPTAAMINVAEVTPNPAGGSTSADQACDAVGYERTVTVRLAAPLGNRVLLNAQGSPLSAVKP